MHILPSSTYNSLLEEKKLVHDYWLLNETENSWNKVELETTTTNQEDSSQSSVIGQFRLCSSENSPIQISIPLLTDLAGKGFFRSNHPILFPRNPSFQEGLDDLSQLSFLNEPEVLNNLLIRYRKFSIYTYCGIVLVAINPYCELAQLYSDQVMTLYHRKDREQVEPHLFVVAEEAYNQMVGSGRSQSIIVSGESGAGKTVSAKYIMKYLISKENLSIRYATSPSSLDIRTIENKILATNPILEAFGNAKTSKNDNSSRFGKFLQISFLPHQSSCTGKVSIWDAQIKTFLLEKSRVTHQAKEEQNFHIFYLMLSSSEYRNRFRLGNAKFKLLPSDSANLFPFKVSLQEVLDAFELFEFNSEQIDAIFSLLAIILHLGNIEVTGTLDESNISSDDVHLNAAAQLLCCTVDELLASITKRTIQTNIDKTVANNSLQQANSVRDSYCRSLYSLLFDYIVQRLNTGLGNGENCTDKKVFISILDIYGFEQFDLNGFEQFCINYANEKLQQEFVRHAFQLEQQLFRQEKVEWPDITYQQNDQCIQVIEDRMGIIDLLDDCCKLSTGTDRTFVQKILRIQPPPKQLSRFPIEKTKQFQPDKFVLHHYAGTIEYSGSGFLDKNSDEFLIPPMKNESFDEICNFTINKRKLSLASRFKESLSQLMTNIYESNTHYIRCIKPNHTKTSFSPDPSHTLSQLRSCGILESIKIYSQGFPTKIGLEEFRARYKIICLESCSIESFVQEVIQTVYQQEVESLNSKTSDDTSTVCNLFRIGKTKIFLRSGVIARLEREKERIIIRAISQIQTKFICNLTRKQFITLNSISLIVQSCYRTKVSQVARLEALFQKASEILFKYCKSYLAKRYFQNSQNAQRTISRSIRIYFRQYSIRIYFVSLLQSIIRTIEPKFTLNKMLQAAIVLQSIARSLVDKYEYDKLKAQSRNLDVMQQKLYTYQCKFIQLIDEKEQLTEALKQYRNLTHRLFLDLQQNIKPNILKQIQTSFTSLACSTLMSQTLEPHLIEPMLTVSTDTLLLHVQSCIAREVKINKFLSDSLEYLSIKNKPDLIESFFTELVSIFTDSSAFCTTIDSFHPTDRPFGKNSNYHNANHSSIGNLSIQSFGGGKNKEGFLRSLYWLSHFIWHYESIGYEMQSVGHHLRSIISLLYSKIANWYKDFIVPNGALSMVESQSLAGYLTGNNPYGQDKWDLDLLTASLDSMLLELEQYGLSLRIKLQLVNCLFRALSTESLNIMLTLKGYCNWKRGMQIQFNISRLMEWARETLFITCPTDSKSSFDSFTESTSYRPIVLFSKEERLATIAGLQASLERLLQASKLVQLNAPVLHDFNILLELGALLSPAQIARLLTMISCPVGTDLELFLPYQVNHQIIAKFVEQFVTAEDSLVIQWTGRTEPIDLSKLD